MTHFPLSIIGSWFSLLRLKKRLNVLTETAFNHSRQHFKYLVGRRFSADPVLRKATFQTTNAKAGALPESNCNEQNRNTTTSERRNRTKEETMIL